MQTTVRPFLMFQGNAEEAMKFYVSLFADGKINTVQRYGEGEAGAAGTVVLAHFEIGGQTILCIDSPVKHAFTFTPSVSLFIECESEEQIVRLASELGAGGEVLMPLAHYGFSRQFTWVNDRFGVSWQINLA